MNEIVIEKINSFNEINAIISDFNFEFCPALNSYVDDLVVYSKKLFNNAVTYAAKDGGKILGFVSFYCNDFDNRTAYLTQIAVKQQYKNKKIGQKLLDRVIFDSKINNMKKVTLEVFKDNIVAISFYKKNGFKYLNNAKENSIYMQLNLE